MDADNPPWTTSNSIAIVQSAPSRNLAIVYADGVVTIDWDAVDAEVADPNGVNRAWAKMLLCARGAHRYGREACSRPYAKK